MVEQRVRKLNDSPVRPGGRYVLYWLRYHRRAEANHTLLLAASLANRLELPLLVFEGLACGTPYANLRRHTFVLEGAAETAASLRKLGIGYTFYLEQRPGGIETALSAVLRDAAAVVTDDYPEPLAGPLPAFDLQAWAVDANCVVPATLIGQRCYAAYSIRPKIHQLLPQFLKPVEPVRVGRRFPRQEGVLPSLADLAACQIDRSVAPATAFRGGRGEAERRLERFLAERLARYSRDKNQPAAHATSDLSPYLHFGYLSPLEVALAVRDYAGEHRLIADEFLEELLVRRELAFNFARYTRRVDSLAELPEWARATLDKHRRDQRDPLYTREQFESAATCDDLWNATQKELLLRGKIHGYYRMYWGKKIVEWSAAPEEALATMIHLHDRYALDGQNPNTYANILWCLGLHDRPWPERPIFGSVRFMSRAGMQRKTDVPQYLREIDDLERTRKELAT